MSLEKEVTTDLFGARVRGAVISFRCCTRSAKKYEVKDRDKIIRNKTKASGLGSAIRIEQRQRGMMSCMAYRVVRGVTARTAFQLVPNESGVRFIKSGTAARFDTFHQAGSYRSIRSRSENPSK